MGQLKPIRLSIAQRYVLRDFLNARRVATMEWASVVHELTMRCGLLALTDEMEALEEAHKASGAKRPFDLQTLMDAGGLDEYGVDSDVLAALRKALDEHKWGVATDQQGREVVVGGVGVPPPQAAISNTTASAETECFQLHCIRLLPCRGVRLAVATGGFKS